MVNWLQSRSGADDSQPPTRGDSLSAQYRPGHHRSVGYLGPHTVKHVREGASTFEAVFFEAGICRVRWGFFLVTCPTRLATLLAKGMFSTIMVCFCPYVNESRTFWSFSDDSW